MVSLGGVYLTVRDLVLPGLTEADGGQAGQVEARRPNQQRGHKRPQEHPDGGSSVPHGAHLKPSAPPQFAPHLTTARGRQLPVPAAGGASRTGSRSGERCIVGSVHLVGFGLK